MDPFSASESTDVSFAELSSEDDSKKKTRRVAKVKTDVREATVDEDESTGIIAALQAPSGRKMLQLMSYPGWTIEKKNKAFAVWTPLLTAYNQWKKGGGSKNAISSFKRLNVVLEERKAKREASADLGPWQVPLVCHWIDVEIEEADWRGAQFLWRPALVVEHCNGGCFRVRVLHDNGGFYPPVEYFFSRYEEGVQWRRRSEGTPPSAGASARAEAERLRLKPVESDESESEDEGTTGKEREGGGESDSEGESESESDDESSSESESSDKSESGREEDGGNESVPSKINEKAQKQSAAQKGKAEGAAQTAQTKKPANANKSHGAAKNGVMNTATSKGAWTADEEAMLKRLVKTKPNDWEWVAMELSTGRNARSVKMRYHRLLGENKAPSQLRDASDAARSLASAENAGTKGAAQSGAGKPAPPAQRKRSATSAGCDSRAGSGGGKAPKRSGGQHAAPVAASTAVAVGEQPGVATERMRQVVQMLQAYKLEQYAATMAREGYDDVEFIATGDEARLRKIASRVGMLHGHAQKFIEYVIAKKTWG